jgi:hypothetical protein
LDPHQQVVDAMAVQAKVDKATEMEVVEMEEDCRIVKAWVKPGVQELAHHLQDVNAMAVQAKMDRPREQVQVTLTAVVWVKPGDLALDPHLQDVNVMAVQAKARVKQEEVLPVEVWVEETKLELHLDSHFLEL